MENHKLISKLGCYHDKHTIDYWRNPAKTHQNSALKGENPRLHGVPFRDAELECSAHWQQPRVADHLREVPYMKENRQQTGAV